MNSLRKALSFVVTVVVLAAMALPASASGGSKKTISLSVSPSILPAGPTAVVTATIKNTGNSNANSFEVDWTTSDDFTVISASAKGTTVYPMTPGLRGPGYSRVIFTQQLPTKDSVQVTLNVSLANPCAPLSINWFAYAWTGAPGPVSSSFTLPEGTYRTTRPSGDCRVEFVKQPRDAFIGSTITGLPFDSAGDPVSVRLVQGSGVPPATAVSLSASPACAIADATATTESGVAQFVTLTSTASATEFDCELTATATGYDSATSDAFDVVLRDGILGCGDSTVVANGADAAQAIGTRLNNADSGECGPQIPYVLIWRDLDGGGQQLQFVKDDLGQPAVAMAFEITWPNEARPTAVSPATGVLGGIELSQQEFIAGQPVPIDLCVGSPVYVLDADTGEFVLESLTPPSGGFPDLVPGGATQYGCVYDREITLEADPDYPVGLKEFIYLQGDWGASRLQ